MRSHLRLSLSLVSLVLALVVPSILIAEAAHSGGAADRPTAAPPPAAHTGPASAAVRRNYGRLPLSFEANRGQADPRVRFLARNGAYSLYLTADEMVLALRDAAAHSGARPASVLRIKLLGASRQSRAHGLEESEGRSNYLSGRDPSRWLTGVPHYGRVRYEGVYPGVDVIYYGTLRQLEYDFNVAPGADPGLILMRVEGARRLRIDDNGDLVMATAAGEVRQRAPHAFQEFEGVRRTVACRYARRGAGRIGFELGAYDRGRPLVIDPVISYSTYLGGVDGDNGTAIAVDAQGNAYVTGYASSYNFPVTPGALQTTRRGAAPYLTNYDAFVAKLNPEGTALVYSTFLGGDSSDFAMSIAVDGAGQAHVAGQTDSTNFPVTPGAHRTTKAGGQDIFVSKLDATGAALLYSTYLGGSDWDAGPRLALGSTGAIYVGGLTQSTNFPVTPGAFQTQPRNSGSWNPAEGFVTKLSPVPSAGLLFSTYLGGGADDFIDGLAVAAGLDDSVYVTGRTSSTNFPVTPGAFQTAHAGGSPLYDAFVTRLNSSGTQAIYSTYFGGPADDFTTAVAVDSAGAAYVVGLTSSTSLPVTPGAFQTTFGGSFNPARENNYDAFVTKFSPDGASLAYSTFYGGSGGDIAHAIALDAQGNAYVGGETSSTDLPVAPDALQATYGGGERDAFFLRLNASGTSASDASYLGGEGLEHVKGVAVDAAGGLYLTGATYSYVFITTPQAIQTYISGTPDAFVTKVALGATGHSVSGRVTNEFGVGLRDVEVGVHGSVTRVARTNADGYYSVNGLPPGAEVTLRASRLGFDFAPADVTLSDIRQNQTVDFSGPAPLIISGRVLNDFGLGVSVPLTISGTENYTINTNYDGSYSFLVAAGGTYTVTPGPDTEYTFAPPSHTLPDLIGDATLDFAAQRPPRILARAVNDWNDGLANFQMTLSGPSLPQPLTLTTDASGYVFFNELERGATYTVTPSDPETNRAFSPAALTVTNIQREEFLTFTALPPLSIGGRVTDPDGYPVTGIATLSGAVNAEVEVNQWGNFFFPYLPRGGDYTITITKPGTLYTFAPPSQSVSNLQELQFFEFSALPPLRILGRIADPNNQPVRATVTLNGTVSATTQADEYGIYLFEELPRGGDYTVTPAYPLYTFTPESRSVTGVQENQYFEFNALPPLRIVGEVLDEAGQRIPSATVTLSGAADATTSADEYGVFIFENLPRGGTYVVTPAHDLYTFTPPSRELPALSENQFVSFSGALRRFTLSGRVADAGGAPLPGVTMTLGGAAAGTTQTDANGAYAFAALPAGGDYTVEPARQFYDFTPARAAYLDLGGDQTANFTAVLRTFGIGGRVTEGAGGVAGVTVQLGGSRTATTQTDASGNYLFAALPADGSYSVTPAHPFYSFAPGGASFDTLPSNQTASFTAARLLYAVGGYALDACGRPIPGVTLALTHDGLTANAQTDAAGFYSFAGVQAGYNYTLAPAGSAYTFNPLSVAFPALSANQAADFTGTPPTSAVEAPALADLYVRGGSAATNFGAAAQLITRLANQTKDTYETYVKFDAGQPCTVSSVKLRLYGKLSSNGTIPVAVYAVPTTTWTETGTNWNNRPAADALLHTVNVSGTAGAWYEWDVTNYVRAELDAGRSTVSFALKATTSTNYQVTFNSREAAGANGPRLAVTSP